MATSWEFPRCIVDHVYDGDTIVLKSIDLGLDTFRQKIRVRFLKVKAVEKDSPGGVEATNALASLVKPDETVRVLSAHWDKYANRIDGLIYNAQGVELGGAMQNLGYCVPY